MIYRKAKKIPPSISRAGQFLQGVGEYVSLEHRLVVQFNRAKERGAQGGINIPRAWEGSHAHVIIADYRSSEVLFRKAKAVGEAKKTTG